MSFVPSNRRDAGRQVEVTALAIDENEMAWCLVQGEVKAWVRKSVCRHLANGGWSMPETVAKSKRFTWL
jgi:hypothetical protein